MNGLRTALGLAGLGGLYGALLRRPVLTWGATAEEAAARLPGDELLEGADGVSHPGDLDRGATRRRLAVARADGPGAARRRLHL